MSKKKPERATQRRGCSPLRVLIGLPLSVVAGGIAYSHLFVPHNLPLPPAVSGERQTFIGQRAGLLSYYVAGTGRPVLLVHSVNAAASANEMRPLFEHLRTTRRVYALDLPGFGFSNRSDRSYTPRLYTDAVNEMLDEIARDSGESAVDVVALSLGCEFVARAATEHPQRFRTLAFITPSGFRPGEQRYGEPGSTRCNETLYKVFTFPLISRPFYDLLTSYAGERYFLNKIFRSPESIDTSVYTYYYQTAHQPGAHHAPYAFVSGCLFSDDIDRVYDALDMPIWLAYGTYSDFSQVNTDKVEGRPNWTTQAFATGGLPHIENPDEFLPAYDAFLETASDGR